jgi:hypothetical protein
MGNGVWSWSVARKGLQEKCGGLCRLVTSEKQYLVRRARRSAQLPVKRDSDTVLGRVVYGTEYSGNSPWLCGE